MPKTSATKSTSDYMNGVWHREKKKIEKVFYFARSFVRSFVRSLSCFEYHWHRGSGTRLGSTKNAYFIPKIMAFSSNDVHLLYIGSSAFFKCNRLSPYLSRYLSSSAQFALVSKWAPGSDEQNIFRIFKMK